MKLNTITMDRSPGELSKHFGTLMHIACSIIIASAASSNDNACMKRVTRLAHSSTLDFLLFFPDSQIA